MSVRPAAEQFGRTADVYAKEELGRYPSDLVIGLCEPDESDVHLDVGTGPGTLIRILEGHVRASVGVDVTPEMMESFLALTRGARAALAEAERLPFDDRLFSLVTCGSVFHHVPDPEAAAAEIMRVLRPGGRFLLIDMAGPEHPARRAVRDEIERVRDPSHVAVLSPSRTRALLWEAGFDVRAEERQVEDKRDEDWARLAGADVDAVREALHLHRRLAGGFQALRWEDGGFVFRRERAYYLAVKP